MSSRSSRHSWIQPSIYNGTPTILHIPACMAYLPENTPDVSGQDLSYWKISTCSTRPQSDWHSGKDDSFTLPHTNNQYDGWNNPLTHLIRYSHPTFLILTEGTEKENCLICSKLCEDLIKNLPKLVKQKQKNMQAYLLTLRQDRQSRASSWCWLQYPC